MKPFDCKTWKDLSSAMANATYGDVDINVLATVTADTPILVPAASTRIALRFRGGAVILAANAAPNSNIIEINGDRLVMIDSPNVVSFHQNGAAFKFHGNSDVVATEVSGTHIYGTAGASSQYFSGNCRSLRYTINTLRDSWRHKREHFNYLCTRASNVGSGGIVRDCGSLVSPDSKYLGAAGSVVMLSGTHIAGRPDIDWDGKAFGAPIAYKSQASDALIVRDVTVIGDTTGPLYVGHFGGANLCRDNDYSGVTCRGSFASWLGVGERTWEQHRGDCGEIGSSAPATTK